MVGHDGAEVRERRRALGLTTKALAVAAGLTGEYAYKAIERWERGETGRPHTAGRVLAALERMEAADPLRVEGDDEVVQVQFVADGVTITTRGTLRGAMAAYRELLRIRDEHERAAGNQPNG